MTGNANPGRVDVVPRREQVPGRGEIGDHPVVPAFLALELDTGVFRPPVKDERRRDSVAGGGEAACRDKGELVILDARMADGDVLRQHQSGVPRWRRGTVWLEGSTSIGLFCTSMVTVVSIRTPCAWQGALAGGRAADWPSLARTAFRPQSLDRDIAPTGTGDDSGHPGGRLSGGRLWTPMGGTGTTLDTYGGTAESTHHTGRAVNGPGLDYKSRVRAASSDVPVKDRE